MDSSRVFVVIGSKISFPVHFDWPIVHFRKISEAQLIRGVSRFHSLYGQAFSSIFPHPLFPNQDGGEFTIASSKTPALQAKQLVERFVFHATDVQAIVDQNQ